jgi:hypothetical protein
VFVNDVFCAKIKARMMQNTVNVKAINATACQKSKILLKDKFCEGRNYFSFFVFNAAFLIYEVGCTPQQRPAHC